MNSKRAMALAVVLALGLGLGSAPAERLGRFGKARKALSAKDFWATVVGWMEGGRAGYHPPCGELSENCTTEHLGQVPGESQPTTKGGSYVDPDG